MNIIRYTPEEAKSKTIKIRKISDEIEVFDDKLKEEVNNLIDYFKSIKGVGLAAPQVGIFKRYAVVNPNRADGEEPYVIINPKVKSNTGKKKSFSEGCLSIPFYKGKVYRKSKLELSYYDVDGNMIERNLEGFEARVFLHEIDHLDGILYIDHMRESDKLFEVED